MCDLINRHHKVYGIPNAGYHELRKRICGTKEPLEPPLLAHEAEWRIAASYESSAWNRQHHCTVRGVPVSKTAIREGDKHVWCLFPDGRVMIVAEANIKATHNRSQPNGSTPQ